MRSVAGLVLAAGASSRMGPGMNKLLEPVGGRPLVVWPVEAMLAAGVDPLFVVLGHEAEKLQRVLRNRAVRLLHQAAWADGMGASIACGARAVEGLEARPDGVLIGLGDLPALRERHVRALVDDFDSAPPGAICVPTHAERRGHPVLFDRRYLAELMALSGEDGARGILKRHADAVREVEIDSEAILADVDTPAALEQVRARAARREARREE